MKSLPNRALFLASLSHRRFSSSSSSSSSSSKVNTTNRAKKPFSYIRQEYRSQAIDEAQKSTRSYLHQNRSLPFVCAEKIAQNSPFCLSQLFQNIRFSSPSFGSDIVRTLRYEPINEFEFFFESIGIDYRDIPRFLAPKTYFFSQDSTVLDSALELFRFGFPWNKLGKLCIGDISIFRKSPEELEQRLLALRDRFGSDNLSVVGMCLAFPYLLSTENESRRDDADKIVTILKRVFVELGVESGVEGNVDTWYEACCKVKFFYDLGVDMSKVEELMCEKKENFVKCPRATIVQKFHYFSRFGAGKVDVGLFLLRSPEILSLDLDKPVISVLGFLKHFGLEEKELRRVTKKHLYVFGRNEMANLPNVMKALNLQNWCFDKIDSSNGKLLATYSISHPEEGVDKRFSEAMEVELSGYVTHAKKKLIFLKRIGFGENHETAKTLKYLQGNYARLDEKFRFLLRQGISHSDACRMLRRSPLMVSQRLEKLELKTNYLIHEMGYSIEFAVNYPDFYNLCFESRIIRRHRFCLWLQDKCLDLKHTMSGMLQLNQHKFIARVYRINPAAPKHYLECF